MKFGINENFFALNMSETKKKFIQFVVNSHP